MEEDRKVELPAPETNVEIALAKVLSQRIEEVDRQLELMRKQQMDEQLMRQKQEQIQQEKRVTEESMRRQADARK